MACQHFPDDQTGAGEDIMRLPSGHDRVDCKREEEDRIYKGIEGQEDPDTHEDDLLKQEGSRQVFRGESYTYISRVPDQNGVFQA